ncbi:MAG: hypothetical protein KDC00_10750, partial [Flavobacteriales bacterium]|nr:hypothetical protein [Flavobacteriales bacterium]
MPLGHTLMVVLENGFGAAVFTSALIVGSIGFAMLWWGVARPMRDLYATLLGAIGGVLVWTGWVEFSFVWVARKLSVAPLMVDGEVATKPEYLVMVSSLGLLGSMLLMFLFMQTRCTFFVWFQKRMGTRDSLISASDRSMPRPLAVIAFLEMVMIIWTFYLVLLLCYDDAIAGDRHPITWIVAFGSLFWSVHLILKLVRIKAFDHAVRYAIPTVVIFWNFVEVMGRWNLFKEIWVHPAEHWLENSLLLGLLIFFVAYYMFKARKDRQRRGGRVPGSLVQPCRPVVQ